MQLISAYKPEHPILPWTRERALALFEELGPERYNQELEYRNGVIRRSEEDPFNYVYKLAGWWLCDLLLGFVTEEEFLAAEVVPLRWKTNEALRDFYRTADLQVLLILGGNRAAKTEYMIWRAVQDLVKFPEIEIWVMHQKQTMSIQYHQSLVWKYLPDAWKDAGRGKGGRDTTYVAYSKQNGFASGAGAQKLTGPEGQSMLFLYYTMDKDDAIQGGNLGSPHVKGRVGYVADELIPSEWVRELRARISTRAAKGLIGFTPVTGYNDTVAEFQDGASRVYGESADPRLEIEDPKKRVADVVRRCENEHMAIVNFHTRYNPFTDYESLLKLHKKDSDDEKLIKFYGLTEKSQGARFVRFDEGVHVVKREVIADWHEPGIVKAFKFPGTNYLICDPARSGHMGKNWCLGWLRVDVLDRWWIFREWPSQVVPVPGVGLLGPWALPGAKVGHQHDGVPGPGSRSIGFTLLDQKREIARLEQWADYAEDRSPLAWDEANGSVDRVDIRYMDSRFANTPSQDHQVNMTLLEKCAEIDLLFVPTFSMEGGATVHEGAEMIVDRLGNPQDPEQPPKLFICEDCRNFIFAMKVWTGLDGQRGSTKDFVDLLRYAAMAQIAFTEEGDGRQKDEGRRMKGYGVRGEGVRQKAEGRKWKFKKG